MPIPGVPKGLRRQVKEAFVGALRSDPLLANNRAVKTWLVWDGDSATAEVTVDQMPACEVRFLGGSVSRITGTRAPGQPMSHADESRLTVLIDLWTPGTDAGDLADLADLVYRALAPQDPYRRTALNERFRVAGIKSWQLTREILPASAESYALDAIAGQGAYELRVQFFS